MTVKEKVIKLYPKMGMDKSGMKFYFDDNNTHYTIRFSGNPIILLEALYRKKGGVNFMDEYKRARNGEKISNEALMKDCINEINSFLELISYVYESQLSPFVVYKNPFNNYR